MTRKRLRGFAYCRHCRSLVSPPPHNRMSQIADIIGNGKKRGKSREAILARISDFVASIDPREG